MSDEQPVEQERQTRLTDIHKRVLHYAAALEARRRGTANDATECAAAEFRDRARSDILWLLAEVKRLEDASTRRECQFWKVSENEWYYRVESWYWQNEYETYGPFSRKANAVTHLLGNGADPDAWEPLIATVNETDWLRNEAERYR